MKLIERSCSASLHPGTLMSSEFIERLGSSFLYILSVDCEESSEGCCYDYKLRRVCIC
jgi:hypothetical protein